VLAGVVATDILSRQGYPWILQKAFQMVSPFMPFIFNTPQDCGEVVTALATAKEYKDGGIYGQTADNIPPSQWTKKIIAEAEESENWKKIDEIWNYTHKLVA
jgi:hypothetical protein